MERIKGFLIALALFIITAGGIHLYAGRQVDNDPKGYALWTREEKSLSFHGLDTVRQIIQDISRIQKDRTCDNLTYVMKYAARNTDRDNRKF